MLIPYRTMTLRLAKFDLRCFYLNGLKRGWGTTCPIICLFMFLYILFLTLPIAALNVVDGSVIGYGWLLEAELDPMGKIIASCSESTLHLWDLDGTLLSVYQSPDRAFLGGIEWSPDGSMIAVADSYRRIIVIRIKDMSVISHIFHLVPVDGYDCASWYDDKLFGLIPIPITWSPNSTMIAVSWCFDQVEIFDTYSGEEVTRIPEEPWTFIQDIDWSPDGKYLLVSQGGPSTLYNVENGEEKRVFEGGGAGCFSSNGSMVATTAGTRFITHDVETGETITFIEGESEGLSIAWSPDNELVATGTEGGQILVWGGENGELIQILPCTYGASSISWQGKYLVAVSRNRTIHVWSATESGEFVLLKILEGWGSWVRKVEWFHEGGRLLVVRAGYKDGAKVYAWNDESEDWTIQLVIPVGIDSTIIESGSLSPDGKALAVTSGTHLQRKILIYDAQFGHLANQLESDKDITEIKWSPANQYLAAGYNGGVDVWDTNTGQITSSLKLEKEVLDLEWSPCGDMLAIGLFDGESTLEIWDPFQSRLLAVIPTWFYLSSIAWSPDGSKIAISQGFYPYLDNSASLPPSCSLNGLGNITLLGIKTGNGLELRVLDNLIVSRMGSLAWAPNSSMLAASIFESGTPNNAILQCLRSIHTDIEIMDTSILILRVEESLRFNGGLSGFTRKISTISWTNDGSLIAAGSEDGTIKIWSTGDIQPILDIKQKMIIIFTLLILANSKNSL